jgi:high affinity Mn2+ porin
MRGRGLLGLGLLAIAGSTQAADLSNVLPRKAPPATSYDWSGFYLGGHFDYALGASQWSSTQAGMVGPSGSLNFSNAYDFSTGAGSYLVGLQAGYDHMSASRWLWGVEADISFPSFVGGSRTFSSPPTGQANYLEQTQFSGTLRGRVGYAPNLVQGTGHWLLYATGGLAWSYEQFSRTQLAGVPAGGAAIPGTVETQFLHPRLGWILGVGVELALASHWTAQFEYLFIDYGSRSVTFPAAAQTFNSGLALSELRFGLNYRFGPAGIDPAVFTKGPDALDLGWFAVHEQTTFVGQYALPFHAPYHGQNSLDSNAGRETWETMFSAGVKLWQGAELWIDPDIIQGFGLSNTEGVAGFVSGAAAKFGSSVPYARVQRAFLRQTFDLGGKTQKVDADLNQFAGSHTADRLVLTVGKFAIPDVFDINKYAHDPRKDFMNWALNDTGSFDYAGDSWGYTYGAAAEWYQGDWTLRGGVFDLSIAPNSPALDPRFGQIQWVGEIERRYELWSHPGKVAITGFLSRGRMGSFQDAINLAQVTGGPANIAAVRKYQSRGGLSVNLEQEVTSELGVFARAGFANGDVEPFDYADIDRTAAAGLALKGKQWGRPDDTFGLAGIINGISAVHERFLNDGGLGILVGDGKLPHPGLEQILETYYAFPLFATTVTFDYQFIVNPAYNRDRGPVSVIGARLQMGF